MQQEKHSKTALFATLYAKDIRNAAWTNNNTPALKHLQRLKQILLLVQKLAQTLLQIEKILLFVGRRFVMIHDKTLLERKNGVCEVQNLIETLAPLQHGDDENLLGFAHDNAAARERRGGINAAACARLLVEQEHIKRLRAPLLRFCGRVARHRKVLVDNHREAGDEITKRHLAVFHNLNPILGAERIGTQKLKNVLDEHIKNIHRLARRVLEALGRFSQHKGAIAKLIDSFLKAHLAFATHKQIEPKLPIDAIIAQLLAENRVFDMPHRIEVERHHIDIEMVENPPAARKIAFDFCHIARHLVEIAAIPIAIEVFMRDVGDVFGLELLEKVERLLCAIARILAQELLEKHDSRDNLALGTAACALVIIKQQLAQLMLGCPAREGVVAHIDDTAHAQEAVNDVENAALILDAHPAPNAVQDDDIEARAALF